MPLCTQASLPRRIRDELVEGCRSRLPYESCGVLYGYQEAGVSIANAFDFVRNVSPRPEVSFRFDPNDWIRISYQAQKNQRTIVGFFHSHPKGPSAPSRLDGEGWDGSGTLWIVDMSERPEGVHAYARDASDRTPRWHAVPLTVSDD